MKRTLLIIIAVVFLFGGVFGIIKGFFPAFDWLSFRYLLAGNSTFPVNETPLYARIYGVLLAILEIISSIIIFIGRKKLYIFAIICVGISILGCFVAVILGDIFAIVSLVLRLIPLYLLVAEYKTK